MTERKAILIASGVFIAVGSGIGLYGGFYWGIPFMEHVVFPWMADLEKTVPRAQGLAVIIALFLAFCGVIIALSIKQTKRVRRGLKDARDREQLRKV